MMRACSCSDLPEFVESPLQRVLHQDRDRHRTHTSWYWCDEGALLLAGVIVAIPHESVPAFLRLVLDGVDPHINHDRTLLHPVPLDKLGLSDGGHNNIGLPTLSRKVLCAAVAHGHGCVFLLEQKRDRHAHNVGPSNYSHVLPVQVYPRPFQKLHTALGCAGLEQWVVVTERKVSHVERVQSIHVLAGIDELDNFLLLHVRGERELHKDAVNRIVCVELLHFCLDVLLRDFSRHSDEHRLDAALCAGLFLHAHIRGTVLSVSHQNHCKLRLLFSTVLTDNFVDLLLNFCTDGLGDRLPVNNLGVCHFDSSEDRNKNTVDNGETASFSANNLLTY
mmetsp:Transcript_5072/g.10117  ORF Transcript_5072/g.10117 Transcript_5072/m.10117 type:complete len:334 (-) Transcript_5072:43-1044(-)